MQIWKMPIRSRRDDFESSPEKVHEARSFCFQNHWTGIGWGIGSLPDGMNEPDKYERAIDSEYPDGGKAAHSAHKSLAHKMACNDLVWCRESNDIYWIGKITGEWIYHCLGAFDEFDLYQVRPCTWYCVGASDNVPGQIKNAFAGRGATISRIHSEYALHGSMAIWEKLTGEKIFQNEQKFAALTLGEIGHDDLEDLVILYVQVKLGWFVIASTAKHSTPATECVLRNKDGKRAYVQVKSGKTGVNIEAVPDGVDKFFVFDLVSSNKLNSDDRVERIFPQDLENFAFEHPFFLPQHLKSLVRL